MVGSVNKIFRQSKHISDKNQLSVPTLNRFLTGEQQFVTIATTNKN
jgi:hypothetical protein